MGLNEKILYSSGGGIGRIRGYRWCQMMGRTTRLICALSEEGAMIFLIATKYSYRIASALTVYLISFISMTSSVVHSSSISDLPESVSFTIAIVDEKEACAPDGYPGYDARDNKHDVCDDLSIGDVPALLEDNLFQMEANVPPGKITLSRELRDGIFNYNEVAFPYPPSDASERKAILFVFEWPIRHDHRIMLVREQMENAEKDIPSLPEPWHGRGGMSEHWIHHERADTLFPLNRIRWTLTVESDEGERAWTFSSF